MIKLSILRLGDTFVLSGELVVDEKIENINSNAFENSNLTRIILHSGIKNIEESALKQVFKEAKELREKENKTVLVVYKSKNFKFQKEKLAEEGFNEIEFR